MENRLGLNVCSLGKLHNTSVKTDIPREHNGKYFFVQINAVYKCFKKEVLCSLSSLLLTSAFLRESQELTLVWRISGSNQVSGDYVERCYLSVLHFRLTWT